ncbi:MAG: hypothetical protein UD574_02945 [Agathobaculum butyriciproducens]|nr:hypothetical protein [Agathobaculum butyriciproducens]
MEEDKITWFSNLLLRCKDKEIAGHSNIYWLIVTAAKGLAEDKITWFSNTGRADKAYAEVWQRIKLHGTQTRAATDPLVLEKKKLHGTQT